MFLCCWSPFLLSPHLTPMGGFKIKRKRNLGGGQTGVLLRSFSLVQLLVRKGLL